MSRWRAPMERALELARRAEQHGDVPVGAVVLGPDAAVLSEASTSAQPRP